MLGRTALVLLVALPAASLAGTPEEPELRDPEGDVDYGGAVPVPVGPLAGMLDVVKVWVDGETGTEVALNLQVLDAAAYDTIARDPQMDIRIVTEFQLDAAPDQRWLVARYTRSDSDAWFLWELSSEGEILGESTVDGSLSGNVFRFQMARADLGSPPAGSALVLQYARTSANPTPAAGLYHAGDIVRADGEAYTFLEGAAPATSSENATQPPGLGDDHDDPPFASSSAPAKGTPAWPALTLMSALGLATAWSRRRD